MKLQEIAEKSTGEILADWIASMEEHGIYIGTGGNARFDTDGSLNVGYVGINSRTDAILLDSYFPFKLNVGNLVLDKLDLSQTHFTFLNKHADFENLKLINCKWPAEITDDWLFTFFPGDVGIYTQIDNLPKLNQDVWDGVVVFSITLYQGSAKIYSIEYTEDDEFIFTDFGSGRKTFNDIFDLQDFLVSHHDDRLLPLIS